MLGLGASWAITVELEGDPDPRTGYLLGIDQIDDAVREDVLPWLLERWKACEEATPEALLPGILQRVRTRLPEEMIRAIELIPEPMARFRLETDHMDSVSIARRYEFSASHRLAFSDVDDAENQRIFGKCSNPNGHGHNYEIEVEVAIPRSKSPFHVTDLDRIVSETIVERYDHRHLNEDLEDFLHEVASVENITARVSELLTPPIAKMGGTLRRVTIWETPRTACTITT